MIALGIGERKALLSHFQSVEAFTQAIKNTGKRLIVGTSFFYSDESDSDKEIIANVFEKDFAEAKELNLKGRTLAHALRKLK